MQAIGFKINIKLLVGKCSADKIILDKSLITSISQTITVDLKVVGLIKCT